MPNCSTSWKRSQATTITGTDDGYDLRRQGRSVLIAAARRGTKKNDRKAQVGNDGPRGMGCGGCRACVSAGSLGSRPAAQRAIGSLRASAALFRATVAGPQATAFGPPEHAAKPGPAGGRHAALRRGLSRNCGASGLSRTSLHGTQYSPPHLPRLSQASESRFLTSQLLPAGPSGRLAQPA
jgi:hypothetical protein